jgi:hypothetical protein
MIKTLKVTVVALFIIAGVALTLTIMLFNRRQVLLGRTVALEKAITQVASTCEVPETDVPESPHYTERDIDFIAAEILPAPRLSDFWQHYNPQLETPTHETLNLMSRQRELQSYFKIDRATMKPQRDPITRERIRTGHGTMQAVLQEVVAASEEQLNRLNATRHQLTVLREETTEAAVELNTRKQELRESLCSIVKRDSKIDSLQSDIQDRENTINEHHETIVSLEGQLLDSEHLAALQLEDMERLTNNVAYWRQRYNDLAGKGTLPTRRTWTTMSRGQKGTVATVDNALNYVVMELNDAFVDEYRQAMESESTQPPPELMIVRQHNAEDVFIAKVKLGTVDIHKGLAVGAVLSSWQQDIIRKDDRVLY